MLKTDFIDRDEPTHTTLHQDYLKKKELKRMSQPIHRVKPMEMARSVVPDFHPTTSVVFQNTCSNLCDSNNMEGLYFQTTSPPSRLRYDPGRVQDTTPEHHVHEVARPSELRHSRYCDPFDK